MEHATAEPRYDKVSPHVLVEPGETFTLADIDGSGVLVSDFAAAPFPRLPDRDSLEVI